MTADPRDRHLRPVTDNDDPELGRTPPNDLDAEQAVIGAILMPGNDALQTTAEIIDPADFYRPAHELIYDATLALYIRGDPTDPVAVMHELTARGHLQRVGGPSYLHTCLTSVPTVANAGYYADIVREHAERRRLIEAGTRIVQLGYNTAASNPVERLDTAHAALTTVPSTTRATGTASAWAPIDLHPHLTGTADTGPLPATLTRRDGQPLLYPGAIHSVSGEPGCGKTWLADLAVAQELAHGHHVAYIDFEDRATTLIGRLRSMSVPDDHMATHLRYIRPDTALTTATRTDLEQAVTGTTLAIVDGITEAMTLHGLSLMDNEDVARWLALIPHRLANLGPAVLQIDHVVKNPDTRGRYAIGGQHKLAGITGVAYKMLTVRAFARGQKGSAKLVIDKDRHGHVGPSGHTIAELVLDATGDDETVYAWLDTPTVEHAEDGSWRPTRYMEKVSRLLEVNPGASGRTITDGVRGTADHVRTALAQLVAEGFVRTEPGAKRSTLHWSVRPFREDDER